MERNVYSELKKWQLSPKHKPLILLGARQVGKTYILQEFGKKEFDKCVYFNCHSDERAKWLFRNLDVDRIIHELEGIAETTIEEGKTLIIIDEIQEVRNGVASLKYFCETHPDLHIAVAGSLLGISLMEGESYPVGKVHTIRMYPMTFCEYLKANGKQKLCDSLMNLEWETLQMHHEKLVSLLREYYFVGGMPEAVNEYVTSHDVNAVRTIHSDIVDSYLRDMAKHTKPTAQKIHLIWESIPSQLARENKKFIFGIMKKGARSADFEDALQWIIDAGLIHKVRRLKKIELPLHFYADPSAFKIYMNDCGLLAFMCKAPAGEILSSYSAFVEFKGALTENYVHQQICATLDTEDIFYYAKENSTQEVDFITQIANSIIPIETKAEVSVKSKSLSGFINNDHADKHLKAVRFSMLPYKDQGWMVNIPLYAVEAYMKFTTNS